MLLKPKNSKEWTLSHYGVYEFLMDVIKREKPDHLAVAFDKGGSQLRNDIFQNTSTSRRHTKQ
jgi:DNA polymerase-1